ncbi:Manganese/iron superoxide dismutase, partial [Gorgonomyces haynaldii]
MLVTNLAVCPNYLFPQNDAIPCVHFSHLMSLFTVPLELPKLNYAYDALEPYLDTATMTLHHTKHHAAYTANANNALKTISTQPNLASDFGANPTIYDLLRRIAREEAGLVPQASSWAGVRTAIRNHGGGFVNHELFFNNLSPAKQGFDSNSAVGKSILAQWGSVDAFKKEFLDAATKVFGSGWAFLVYLPKTKKLQIVSTANQDIPEFAPGLAGSDAVSVLGLDVWEHAYYLKYQNLRGGYLDAWWQVVNWADVNNRYEQALKA